MKLNKKLYILLIFICFSSNIFSMHIMEGFLPPVWSGLWFALCVPFVLIGFNRINKSIKENPRTKMLIAMVGAFAFVLSALKIPSVTGSCSHPTGVGLGAILFGPFVMSVLGLIVLLFQAILLAHGGLTTLGANTFSMAIMGPIASYIIYKVSRKSNISQGISVFLAAALGDLITYIVTSLQLAVAFPDPVGGVMASASKFMGIFALTQVPLAISEGILTVIVFNILDKYNRDVLDTLDI